MTTAVPPTVRRIVKEYTCLRATGYQLRFGQVKVSCPYLLTMNPQLLQILLDSGSDNCFGSLAWFNALRPFLDERAIHEIASIIHLGAGPPQHSHVTIDLRMVAIHAVTQEVIADSVLSVVILDTKNFTLISRRIRARSAMPAAARAASIT